MHPQRVSIRHGLRLQFMRGGLLEPVPVPPPWGAYTSRSITLQRGRAIALLRFVSIRSAHVCHMCVAGFLYQIRLHSYPFPVPASRSAYCVPFVGFVSSLRLLRPRKTLARSPSPFPASLRYTASSTASDSQRRCCFSPPLRGAAAAAAAASHTASMNFQLQSYGQFWNLQIFNAQIYIFL